MEIPTRGATHCLEAWGELACFTRPELKVERYSYPVMTPSAARGLLDAIYWRPGCYWQVERIEILNPPRYIALRRNEVKDKAPGEQEILAWREARRPPEPLWADADRDLLGTGDKGRTQRQTMALKDVGYRLHAHLRLRGGGDPRPLDHQFRRRVAGGKCLYQPYLGCREFPAWFAPARADGPPPVALDLDLGWMLYDVFDLASANDPWTGPSVSLFQGRVRGGVLEVPPYDSPAVVKSLPAHAHA